MALNYGPLSHPNPLLQTHRLRANLAPHFLKFPLTTPKFAARTLRCSPPVTTSATEHDLMEALAQSDGAEKSLPAVRVYENDLARLSLVGAVDYQQALTGAAADGGEAADEHVSAGMQAMVVETVFPGPPEEHSTVSTRLFLPAGKVKEKAKRLRNTLTKDILSSTTSKNILAMTFRQVILQQLSDFELTLFRPGIVRRMDDLGNIREVPVSCNLTSSDERVISVLAEVICVSALENTKKYFQEKSLRKSSKTLFPWFRKPKSIASNDSSVILYTLFDDEIVSNAELLLEKFNAERAEYKPVEVKSKINWWPSSTYSILEKVGGPEFGAWVSEYVPAYKLQVDAGKLKIVKFNGWKESAGNRWEVHLTHSQMVCLANILDMYFEDVFTLPGKQLLCNVTARSSNFSPNKSAISLLKMLSIVLASGFVLVTISVLGQLFLPHLINRKKYTPLDYVVQSSDCTFVQDQSTEAGKLESYCSAVIRRIKDSFGWPGEVMISASGSAWTGDVPEYLRRVDKNNLTGLETASTSATSEKSDELLKASAQDIASYQVVLSADGKIVGFQPLSRVAVNNWSANPLARELYGGKNLCPGLVEPGLKIRHPGRVVVLELLMSVNSESSFALVRPFLPYGNSS